MTALKAIATGPPKASGEARLASNLPHEAPSIAHIDAVYDSNT